MGRFSLYFIVLLSIICSESIHAQENNTINSLSPEIKPGEIIVKLDEKPTSGNSKTPILNQRALQNLPFARSASHITNQPIAEQSHISGIYKVQLKEGESVAMAIRRVKQYSNVVYAEPIYANYLLSTPNDPKANPTTGDQYYLTNIKAYEAWDITKGNSKIIIGISDTGVDFNHNDISPKIYTNPIEIENNLDDDNNGYIDDINGYDFANEDNNAQSVGNFHGNRVAGIAGAATNNNVGMAGVGYNSTVSPLKIFKDNENFSFNAYESITYAADNGYDIINLSWGGSEQTKPIYPRHY